MPARFQAAVARFISDGIPPYRSRTGAHSTFVAELIPFLGQTMAYDALPIYPQSHPATVPDCGVRDGRNADSDLGI